jgi:DNA-binding NarL/FixJ family response regulator
MTTVLIADDHPTFRSGLKQIIESCREFKLAHEAGTGTAALAGIRKLRPAVAILDMNMPEMDGLRVARAVQAEKLSTAIVFLTMYQDEDMFNEAMDLGAKAYVLKESAVADILDSIRAAAAGRHYLSPAISEFLLRRQRSGTAFHTAHPELDKLTPAERRILGLIASNKTSKEIAADLKLSPRTVENHRANVCAKLNLRGIHSLVKFAFDNRSRL